MDLKTIGIVRSSITEPNGPAKMEHEAGAVRARIEIDPQYAEAMVGLEPGMEIDLFTWLHLGRRDVMQVHPRGDKSRPMRGVFATRSPWRPNPIGLHRVTIAAIPSPLCIEVDKLEAIDQTPVIDIKTRPSSVRP